MGMGLRKWGGTQNRGIAIVIPSGGACLGPLDGGTTHALRPWKTQVEVHLYQGISAEVTMTQNLDKEASYKAMLNALMEL